MVEKCFEFEDKEICLTEKQIELTKKHFLESYEEAQKEVEGYKGTGIKIPSMKRYEFEVSKELASKQHKEMHYRNALRLIQESDIKKVKNNLKFYQKVFEDDVEVKPKIKNVKEFFGVED